MIKLCENSLFFNENSLEVFSFVNTNIERQGYDVLSKKDKIKAEIILRKILASESKMRKDVNNQFKEFTSNLWSKLVFESCEYKYINDNSSERAYFTAYSKKLPELDYHILELRVYYKNGKFKYEYVLAG